MITYKEYEYGWYLHNGFNNKWCDIGSSHNRIHGGNGKLCNDYSQGYNGLIKQLPKLKNVVFIYGDYRDI